MGDPLNTRNFGYSAHAMMLLPSPQTALVILSCLTWLTLISSHFVWYYLRVWGLQKLSVCIEGMLASVTFNGALFFLFGLVVIFVDSDCMPPPCMDDE